jgi:DNA-binding transcriptional ArsR family regulator
MSERSLDEHLHILADQRRRQIIQHLRTGEENATTLEELTDRVNGDDTARAEVAISLHHHHLPKLATYELVEYDHDTGTVRYRSDANLEEVLDHLPEELPRARP